MQVSQARIEANRRNAQASTGPRTPEGKMRSRANALTHGLCATTCVPEDLEAVQTRAQEWTIALKPQNRFHAWLIGEMSILSIRIDRAERMERRLRDRHSLRAEVNWDEDRRQQAEDLGERIARKPAAVVQALRRTPQGCEWLMSRWAMLAQVADANGSWTAEQTRLAFDLLGTPPEFREGHRPGATVDLDGKLEDAGPGPADVARREIAALDDRRAVVAELDLVDQSLAEVDLLDDTNAELRRLRRYEGALHTRLRWCMTQLQHESPHKGVRADAWPKWVMQLEELAADQAEIEKPAEVDPRAEFAHPPFDLEPHECPPPGVAADIPAILLARRQAKVRKADARREARRRKLERLRS